MRPLEGERERESDDGQSGHYARVIGTNHNLAINYIEHAVDHIALFYLLQFTTRLDL